MSACTHTATHGLVCSHLKRGSPYEMERVEFATMNGICCGYSLAFVDTTNSAPGDMRHPSSSKITA
eukprot:246879-Pelagomonas_calceolata.AAC.1